MTCGNSCRMNAAVSVPAVAAGDDPSLALRAESQRHRSRWPLAGGLPSKARHCARRARQQVAAAYNGVNGRAGSVRRGQRALSRSCRHLEREPLDDFAKLFAPAADRRLFNTQLRPYVNTTGKT